MTSRSRNFRFSIKEIGRSFELAATLSYWLFGFILILTCNDVENNGI